MSEDERSYYFFNLNKHTEKIKTAFGSLVFDLKNYLEQKNPQDIIIFLNWTISDEILKAYLKKCTTTAELFDKLYGYSSFFDFEYIKLLARKFGSQKIKMNLKKYITMFQSYLKRRIVEIPDYAFDGMDQSEKVYVVKTDRIFKDFTAKDLKRLQYEMNKILNNTLLCLKHVEEGCVQITFRGFEKEEFVITPEQQQDLRNLGILSISYGDHFVDIKQFMKESVPSSKLTVSLHKWLQN